MVAGTPSSLALFGWYAPLRGTADPNAHAGEASAITGLESWNGQWVSAAGFLDDPALAPLYQAIDEAAPNHTLEDARALLHGMGDTSFDWLTIAGQRFTYRMDDRTLRCEYTFVGERTAEFEGVAYSWYLAELSGGDEGCTAYRYVALTPEHGADAGGLSHFHLRYSAVSLDDVVNNPAYAIWFPFLLPKETSAADLATGLITNAAGMAPLLDMMPDAGAGAPAQTRLIIADTNAGGLSIYDIPEWTLVAEFPDLTFADHPGYIVLPDGRVLFTTQENELIVLDAASATPAVVGSVALPGTAIHLAVDPNLAFAVVSTLHDEEAGAGEDTLTMIDLATLQATAQPIQTGEPGVLIGDGVLLHRDGGEIGRLQAFALENFGTHDPEGIAYVDIGAYGHGEAIVNVHAYIATDDGIDIVHIDGDQLDHESVLPWNVSGREGGRGYYMRADAHGNLWSYLRIVANPEDDAAWENWQDWQNDGYLIDTRAQEALRFELGPGLVYRMALSSKYALYSRLHPDGDEAILVDADPASATFAQIVARISLPATTAAPVAGVAPWEAAGQRITGITPDGTWGFVSGGGDGIVHVIDTQTQAIIDRIETPTALNRGGYLLVVQPGQPVVDTVGR
jgi:Zn/Cd-binding protein ZinT